MFYKRNPSARKRLWIRFFSGFSGTGSSLSEEVMPGFHFTALKPMRTRSGLAWISLSVHKKKRRMPSQVVRPVRRDGLSGWIMRISSHLWIPRVSMRGVAWVIVVTSWENAAGQASTQAQHWAWSFLGLPPHVSRWSYVLLCHFIRSNHHRVPLNGTLEFP